MRCVECGHEIKDGAVFCIRCGAMQVSSNQNQAVKAANASTGGPRNVKSFEPTPKRGGRGIVVFIIAAIAVLAAIVALAMFVLNPGSSGGSTSSQSVAASSSSTSSDSSASSSSSSSSASSSSSSKSASSKSSSKSASSASATAAGGTAATGGSNAARNANGTQQGTANGATNQQQAQPAQQQQQTYTAPAPEPEPQPAATATDGSYMLSDSSTRLYSKAELENMSSYDLWIARNEIFARHGRGFNDPDLQAYFDSKTWYTRLYSPAEWDASQSVNSTEAANAALMLEVEEERGSSYL